jgi:hypothetical protein
MFPVDTDHLSIYLNDHLAGATAGLELARHVAANNPDGPKGRALAHLARELEEDRGALLDIMRRLSRRRDRVKVILSWGAEKAGRLKLNGGVLGYSSLSRLEELELLSLGVEGKLALWQALLRTHGPHSSLEGAELEELIGRAKSQRRMLERQRRQAAEVALGSS